MEMIVEKLKKFGYVDDEDADVAVGKETVAPMSEKGSVEDIFYAEDGNLPDSRGGMEEVRFPWEKRPNEGDGDAERSARKKKSHSSLAELTLPEGEIRRLRHLAIRTTSKTKVSGAGVTKEVVDKVHEKWRTEEVVRLKCEGPPTLNMRRMHEILERKTGGLVIWRSGSSVSLYRGVTYESQSVNHHQSINVPRVDTSWNSVTDKSEALSEDKRSGKRSKDVDISTEIKYEHEMEKLLNDLGPRLMDWPGSGPLPVDADLLPGVVPNYNPPFRILPYGVRRNLGVKDQTTLRRLGRVLPPHFAVGRSRQLQGLAAAMVKLWEKSSIAKIALKRGVQITTSERMAEDLKKLTGGTLLCRNKDYIVFYRGKDFLCPEMTEALLERERLAKSLQDEEEQARLRASFSVSSIAEAEREPAVAGTLGETLEADTRWGKQLDDNVKKAMLKAAELAKHASLVKKLERKLSIAENRLYKAEKALAKVEEFLTPAEHKSDPEGITDEERFMFRKLGLKMKAFLLLGRRGVFGGTVENMHLHWKYRELVKIIVKVKTFAQVKDVALSLEAESGGILVSVDKISKGFAIIVYRGKDYKRPVTLRPKNLLTKRKALARSIELQRREALSRHIANLNKQVETLKLELDQMEAVKERGDDDLYAKLDTIYLSADEETEDEGDDAFLETMDDGGIYISSDDEDDIADNYIGDDGNDNDVSND